MTCICFHQIQSITEILMSSISVRQRSSVVNAFRERSNCWLKEKRDNHLCKDQWAMLVMQQQKLTHKNNVCGKQLWIQWTLKQKAISQPNPISKRRNAKNSRALIASVTHNRARRRLNRRDFRLRLVLLETATQTESATFRRCNNSAYRIALRSGKSGSGW